jgi:uncharacterized integral membrane protein
VDVAAEESPSGANFRAFESGGKWVIWVAAFVALVLALLFAY